MAITIEDLVSAVCSDLEALPTAAPSQRIFMVPNAIEAKLAFDLLVAYGFDTKLYNENTGAKLYVTTLKSKALSNENMLAEALAFGRHLKAFKHAAQALTSDPSVRAAGYTIGFINTALQDKQITLHITAAKTAPAPLSSPSAPVTVQAAAPRLAQAAKQDEIFMGPAIMRQPGMRKNKSMYDNVPDTFWKQFKLYVKGNSLSAGITLIACILALIVIFTMFVLSKAFLCPDFASMKDKHPPWYCSYHEVE